MMTSSLMQFSGFGQSGSDQLHGARAGASTTCASWAMEQQSKPSEDQVAIAAKQIEMVYRTGGQEQAVLQDINLKIQQGTIQLLMGPSGSGKTTLLSILGGILSPTNGHVCLLGTDITQLSKRNLAKFRLHHIGFIFQGFNLFDALSATENIVVALKIKGIRPRQARQEALYWLDQVGLADKANHLPKNLSGGQKQRVAIARALAGNPPLIMADEPTAALDSHSGHMVIEMLCNLAKQSDRTVLMVTHDPRIQNVADQVTYLEDGRLQDDSVAMGSIPSDTGLAVAPAAEWPQSA